MPETTSGLWDPGDIYRRVAQGTWVREDYVVSWSPGPAGTPFTTGSYQGVDFTASATFTVSTSRRDIEYVVVAGGGANIWNNYAAGAGAGGYREGTLSNIGPGSYTVTIGAGGTPSNPIYPSPIPALQGNPSVFSTITSTGGGTAAYPGGSGGGGLIGGSGAGAGNTPPTSPPQGNSGGSAGASAGPFFRSPKQGGPYSIPGGNGGGGGAGGVGENGTDGTPSVTGTGGAGGIGKTTTIKGTPLNLAGGGAAYGGAGTAVPYGGGYGSPVGGSFPYPFGLNGATNTGGGAGGSAGVPVVSSDYPAAGGSGRVIIRWLKTGLA